MQRLRQRVSIIKVNAERILRNFLPIRGKMARTEIVGESMRLRRLTTRARQRRWGEGGRAARRRAAYPPTTWRTVTRLQSIKCVRLLWLMHYEAIKNGNYSAVLSAAPLAPAPAPAPARSRTLSRTGPHSMSDEYERRCSMHCSEYNARRYAGDTRTTAKCIPDAPYSRRSVATFGLHGVLRAVRNAPLNVHYMVLVRKSVAFGKISYEHSDISDI